MQVIPSHARLHGLFEYRDGDLYRKKNGKLAGHKHILGYLKVRVDGKIYMGHRLIYKMFNKDFDGGFLDHINNNTMDNRIENLRLASRAENNQNSVLRKDNSSGVKGVSWNQRDKRWTVAIGINGKRKHFGNYKDLELAELVSWEVRDKFHGKFANYGATV